MSKELKALERIKTLSKARGMLNYPEIIEKFDLIENALKEWKIWKEALETGDYDSPEKKALEIIVWKNVDIWLIKNADYKTYCRVRKEARVDNTIYCDDGAVVENELTLKEYNFLREISL